MVETANGPHQHHNGVSNEDANNDGIGVGGNFRHRMGSSASQRPRSTSIAPPNAANGPFNFTKNKYVDIDGGHSPLRISHSMIYI